MAARPRGPLSTLVLLLLLSFWMACSGNDSGSDADMEDFLEGLVGSLPTDLPAPAGPAADDAGSDENDMDDYMQGLLGRLPANVPVGPAVDVAGSGSDTAEENSIFFEGQAAEAQAQQAALMSTHPPARPRKNRGGRPRGSNALRAACAQLQVPDDGPPADGQQVAVRSPTRGIAHARECRKRKLAAETADAEAVVAAAATLKTSPREATYLVPLARALDSVRTSASILQCGLLNAAAFSWDKQDLSVRENSLVMQLVQTPVVSNRGLAKIAQRSENHVGAEIGHAASAIHQSGLLLWAGLLQSLANAISAQELKPVAVTRRFRYDETPLKSRVRVLDRDTGEAGQDSADHAKLMQTEFLLQFVCQRARDGEFVIFSGRLPTILQAVERTTARCTKRCLLNLMDALPNLTQVAEVFPVKRSISCCDRYAANQLAEKSIKADDPRWVRGQFFCDSHRVAQVQRCNLQLVAADVSGMLSCSLAQRDLGALTSLRQLLREILLERLVICYDEPPQGRAEQYRTQLFDKLLPLPTKLSRARKDCQSLLRLRQRFVLGQLLNGDLESPEVVHYCRFNCCKNAAHTEWKVATHLVNALLPHKCPRLVQTRWTGQEACITWCSLLLAHHGLLLPLLTRFAGLHVPDNMPSGVSAAAVDDGVDDIENYIQSLQRQSTPSLGDGVEGPLREQDSALVFVSSIKQRVLCYGCSGQ